MKLRLPLLALLFAASISASAQVKLSPLFGDHAVLQRERPIPIWGTAKPGETLHLTLAKDATDTTADAKGDWHTELAPLPAGGPFTLEVSGSSKVAVHDLYIGEVWLASGQSNMEIGVGIVRNLSQELATANHPLLRFFTVARNPTADPVDTLDGKWITPSADNLRDISAVSYFFGRNLQADLNIPVGIVVDAVGNTPAEAWTPYPKLAADPTFAKWADSQLAVMRSFVSKEQTLRDVQAWEQKNDGADPGDKGTALGWNKPTLPADQANGWKTITLPIDGPKLGIKGPAAIWVRLTINLPDRKYNGSANLDLGPMREMDTVYFDGVKVGEAPDKITFDRNLLYPIPAKLLSPGPHTIAVRVFSHVPPHLYLGSRAATFNMAANDGAKDAIKIPLNIDWQYRKEYEGPPVSAEAIKAEPMMPGRFIFVGSALYNGMIHPLKDLSVRGLLWYQGENNAGAADVYPRLMGYLLSSWREQLKQPNLPFFLVQLPNYKPEWTGWDYMREQQQALVKATSNSGMAVTIDIGETENIHPRDKRPVGDRLALLARHRVYGEPVEDTGPTYQSMKIEGPAIRIQLTHAAGLKSLDLTIPNFVIAGEDKKFYPAAATISGSTILVQSPQVPHPVAVRYAFSQDPEGCNVYNAANLPMAPFRTDDWEIRKR